MFTTKKDWQTIVPNTRMTGAMKSQQYKMGGNSDEAVLASLHSKGRAISAIGIMCEEVCVHGVHFLDDGNSDRLIIPDGPTIISIRPALNTEEVSPEDCMRGCNVRVNKGDMIKIKGGFPFRLCGWVEERKYISILLGGSDGRLQSIPVCLPPEGTDIQSLTSITNYDENSAMFRKAKRTVDSGPTDHMSITIDDRGETAVNKSGASGGKRRKKADITVPVREERGGRSGKSKQVKVAGRPSPKRGNRTLRSRRAKSPEE